MGRGDLADFGHGFWAVSRQFLVAYRATTNPSPGSGPSSGLDCGLTSCLQVGSDLSTIQRSSTCA